MRGNRSKVTTLNKFGFRTELQFDVRQSGRSLIKLLNSFVREVTYVSASVVIDKTSGLFAGSESSTFPLMKE